jgi:hypothetical protein
MVRPDTVAEDQQVQVCKEKQVMALSVCWSEPPRFHFFSSVSSFGTDGAHEQPRPSFDSQISNGCARSNRRLTNTGFGEQWEAAGLVAMGIGEGYSTKGRMIGRATFGLVSHLETNEAIVQCNSTISPI